MKKIYFHILISFTIITLISVKLMSQPLDSLTEDFNQIYNPQDKIVKLSHENWMVTLSNDLTFEYVSLVKILGDSILLARDNSKSLFHVKDIKRIIYKGTSNPGKGFILGLLGGAAAGVAIGGVLSSIGQPDYTNFFLIISTAGGAIIGGITGIIIGSTHFTDYEEYNFTSMSYTEKIITIRTKIFGLKPYE